MRSWNLKGCGRHWLEQCFGMLHFVWVVCAGYQCRRVSFVNPEYQVVNYASLIVVCYLKVLIQNAFLSWAAHTFDTHRMFTRTLDTTFTWMTPYQIYKAERQVPELLLTTQVLVTYSRKTVTVLLAKNKKHFQTMLHGQLFPLFRLDGQDWLQCNDIQFCLHCFWWCALTFPIVLYTLQLLPSPMQIPQQWWHAAT